MDLASQGVDGYAGSRKARGGTDAEGPARAEGIRHPADDRCANRRAAERDADAKRITRPRIAGSVESCIRLFVVLLR